MKRYKQARALAAAHAVQRGAALVEADEDKLEYGITFDVPDEGLLQVPLTQGTANEPGRLGDQSRRMGRIRSRITIDAIERLWSN
jgi:hypothetical protein